MAKRWIGVVIFVALLAVLIGWRLQQNKAAASAMVQARAAMIKKPPVVSLAPAAVRDIVHTFETVGTVQAPQNVNLASKVTGKILFLQAEPGDPVRAGQVLARIDPAQVQAQVAQQQAALNSAEATYQQVNGNLAAQGAAARAAVTDAAAKVQSAVGTIRNAQATIGSAQANLDNAGSQFNRTYRLFRQNFIAAQDVDTARTQVRVQSAAVNVARAQLSSAEGAYQSALAQEEAARHQEQIVLTTGAGGAQVARSQVEQARALLANAQAQFSDTELTSPVNGFVIARNMDAGSVASPGTTILSVGYIQQVWVTVPVPEEEDRHITLGMSAEVTFDGLPGRKFTGTVTQNPPSADTTTRQFPVRVTLQNPQGVIKPGMSARVTFVTQRIPHVIVVPPEAIQKGAGGSAVTVVGSDNIAHRRPVVTGASDASGVAIVQGIQAGEKVVVVSGGPIKDGTLVSTGGGRPGRGGGGGGDAAGGGSAGSAGGGGAGNGAGNATAGGNGAPGTNGTPGDNGTTPGGATAGGGTAGGSASAGDNAAGSANGSAGGNGTPAGNGTPGDNGTSGDNAAPGANAASGPGGAAGGNGHGGAGG